MMTNWILGASIGLLSSAALADVPTVVGPDPDAVSIAVSYADLDLSSERAQDTLRARVRGAARQICFVGSSNTARVQAIENGCFTAARLDAYRQIDRVVGTAYAGAGGRAVILVSR